MQEDAGREDRADEPLDAERPAAGPAPPGIVEGREQEGAAQRRRSIGRGGGEILQNRALQRCPDGGKTGHGSPSTQGFFRDKASAGAFSKGLKGKAKAGRGFHAMVTG